MSITQYRDWTYDQTLAAYRALYEHAEETKDHPMMVLGEGSAKLAIQRLRDGEYKAAYVGTGFLMIYAVGPTWFSSKDMLHEVLLRRVLPIGTFDEAVDDMKELARTEHCVALVAGNGRMRPGLRKLYEREGARVIGETYFMEV